MRRQALLEKGRKLLDREGYASVNASSLRSFFDVIAEKQGMLYVMKFIDNIDSLSGWEAAALLKLSYLFGGRTIVVGAEYKGRRIRQRTRFIRHGIACVSHSSLESVLHGEEIPETRPFIGQKIEIDCERLRQLRALYGISMRRLAELAGVSKDSICRYESGREDITERNLSRLEGFFSQELLRIPASSQHSGRIRYGRFLNTKLRGIALNRDPFIAVANGSSRYEAGREADPRTMRKWAIVYRSMNELFGDYPFFVVAQGRGNKTVDGVPLIESACLANVTDEYALRSLIAESARY
jgi:putative transcriptional regulator